MATAFQTNSKARTTYSSNTDANVCLALLDAFAIQTWTIAKLNRVKTVANALISSSRTSVNVYKITRVLTARIPLIIVRLWRLAVIRIIQFSVIARAVAINVNVLLNSRVLNVRRLLIYASCIGRVARVNVLR
jgi:hypothetical protein